MRARSPWATALACWNGWRCCPTHVTGGADGTPWPACWPSAPWRWRPAPAASPRSPSGPATRPARSERRWACAVTRSPAAGRSRRGHHPPGAGTGGRRRGGRHHRRVAGRPAAPAATTPTRPCGGRQDAARLGPRRPPGAPAGRAGPPRRGRAGRGGRSARHHELRRDERDRP